jgi:hypothetical protein
VVRVRALADALELAFEVPEGATLDRDNLRARANDPGALLELASHFESLSEHVLRDDGRPAHEMGIDGVRRFADAPVKLVARVDREHVLAQDGLAEEIAGELLHLYKIIAWAEDNDGVRPSAKRREKPKRAAHERGDVTRKRAKRRREEREEESGAASVATPERIDEPTQIAAQLPRRDLRTLKLAHKARVVDIDPTRPIERGTTVYALAGPFEGKTGVVRELDEKGQARVMFGLLAATVDLKDLAACAPRRSDRPVLSSSHKRGFGADPRRRS